MNFGNLGSHGAIAHPGRSALLQNMQTRPANQGGLESLLEELSLMPEALAAEDDQEGLSRQRNNGVYYTSFALAEILVKQAILEKGSSTGSFLEPCVGGGAFFYAFVNRAMLDTKGSQEDLQGILDRCYIADNDPVAIENLLEIAPLYFQAKFGHAVQIPKRNVLVGDSLWEAHGKSVRNLPGLFDQEEGFDFVITNPPYRLLKKNSKDGEHAANLTTTLAKKAKSTNDFEFLQGTPNLYKLFTEAILKKWLKKNGVAGLLVPRGLLSDGQSSALRHFLLSRFKLGQIINIEEGSLHFRGVGQAFSMFTAHEGSRTDTVVFAKIPTETGSAPKATSTLQLSDVAQYSSTHALFDMPKQSFNLLRNLSKASPVKNLEGIVNFRGEFDVTLDAGFISPDPTGLVLVHGANIGHFQLKKPTAHVDPKFLDRPKGKWVAGPRIACQQISNMNQQRRLKWAFIPEGHILANSCNFLAVDEAFPPNASGELLFYLLGIMNSSLMNERFKLLSPNNHVSNTEISSFPVGQFNSEIGRLIANQASLISGNFNPAGFEVLDRLVSQCFGIGESTLRLGEAI